MSLELDRQLREYARQLDREQGVLSFDDVLERTGVIPVIPTRGSQRAPHLRRWLAVAAAVMLVLAVGIRLLSTGDDTVQPPTTVRSDYPATGPVEPGTYYLDSSAQNVAGFVVTVPEGWETQYGSPSAFKYSPDGEVAFRFATVDWIYADPCAGSEGGPEALLPVGPSVDDLVNALLEQPHTLAAGPFDATFGGLPAKRVDLTMEHNAVTATCNQALPGELQIWLDPPDDYYVLLPNGSDSVYILEVDGQRQVFLAQIQDGAPEENIDELQGIIDSIRFEPVSRP